MSAVIRGLGALSVIAVAGCHSLEISNPNEPDRRIAIDPATIEAIAGGSLRTWFNAYTGLRSAGVLSAQARTYGVSWNNGNLNFYSGLELGANDTTTAPLTWARTFRYWQNDQASAGRTSVEAFWGGGNDESSVTRAGFYSALSSVNDALRAIRKQNIQIVTASRTKRTETLAVLMQGMVLAQISLNYDQGYIVDEDTDTLAIIGNTLPYANRKAVRDAAITKLQAAIALANANAFTTDGGWANGIAYSNVQLAKIANTVAAMTLAWYPRDDTETGTQVNWTQVIAFASNGMSTGTPVELAFNGDGGSAWTDEVLNWCESFDTCRLNTRVSHFLDPATQKDPYPVGIGNPQPNSLDARLGNGSFGDADMVDGFGNAPKDAGAGTDFAWSDYGEIQRPDRGYYHQSNLGHIRYDASGVQSGDDIYGGYGYMPVISSTINDLIWAEALLRRNGAGDAAAAAALIDKTRVTRGNLSSALLVVGTLGAPTDGPCMANGKLAKNGGACTLWSELLYELEIELIGLGPAPFYNQRHLPNVQATNWEQTAAQITAGSIFNGPRLIQGLLPGTPREMPVPAKELGVKGEPLYTWGGAGAAHSATP